MENGWEVLVKDQMRLSGAGLGRGSWAVSGRSARLGVGICGVAEGGIVLDGSTTASAFWTVG
jgi:hypothetical protein